MNSQGESDTKSKQDKNQRGVKFCLGCFSIVILIIVIVLIVDISNDKPVNPDNGSGTNSGNSSDTKKSDEEVIKDTINAKYSGKNNRDQDNIRSVDVINLNDGSYTVMIKYNADEGYSSSSTRKDIIYTSSQMFKTIYKETGKEIMQAGIFAYYPLTDKYGNNSDEVVYKCTLDKETADKVNWDQNENQLFSQTLPNLWSASNDLLK